MTVRLSSVVHRRLKRRWHRQTEALGDAADVGEVHRAGVIAEVHQQLVPGWGAPDGTARDDAIDRGRVVPSGTFLQDLVTATVRGDIDRVQVDLSARLISERDRCWTPISDDFVALVLQVVHDPVQVSAVDDQVEVTVLSGLLPE